MAILYLLINPISVCKIYHYNLQVVNTLLTKSNLKIFLKKICIQLFGQFIVTFTQGWVIKKRTSNNGGCCFSFVRLGQGGNNKIGQGLTRPEFWREQKI